jgi:hypothetical protein
MIPLEKAMADFDSSSCIEIARGGVGESGASSLLIHEHNEAGQKLAVLRNAETSLCPNTGAVGMLVVNGQPVAQGDLTEVGSSIQSTINSGDVLAAVIQAIPKFNEISCVRLGELSVVLLECDPSY